MQMSRLYHSTNVATRAAQLRADSIACRRDGFDCSADVAWEQAEWIDPTPRGWRRLADGSLLSPEQLEEMEQKATHKQPKQIPGSRKRDNREGRPNGIRVNHKRAA